MAGCAALSATLPFASVAAGLALFAAGAAVWGGRRLLAGKEGPTPGK